MAVNSDSSSALPLDMRAQTREVYKNVYFPIGGKNKHQNTVLLTMLSMGFYIFHRV